MRYISLNQLEKEFGLNPLMEKDALLELLRLHQSKTWKSEEIECFLSIQTAQTLVFNGWIEQHEGLRDLLLFGTVSSSFFDKMKWKQHQLYPSFQSYISNFFDLKISENKTHFSFSDWSNVFSYFELMENEQRFFTEQKCYAVLKKDLNLIFKSIESQVNINSFESEVSSLLSDSVLEVHSFLSSSSNSLKIEFVERVLALFKHRFFTAKLANWSINQLQKLMLNEQQLTSLNAIKSGIVSETFRFREISEQGKNNRR